MNATGAKRHSNSRRTPTATSGLQLTSKPESKRSSRVYRKPATREAFHSKKHLEKTDSKSGRVVSRPSSESQESPARLAACDDALTIELSDSRLRRLSPMGKQGLPSQTSANICETQEEESKISGGFGSKIDHLSRMFSGEFGTRQSGDRLTSKRIVNTSFDVGLLSRNRNSKEVQFSSFEKL